MSPETARLGIETYSQHVDRLRKEKLTKVPDDPVAARCQMLETLLEEKNWTARSEGLRCLLDEHRDDSSMLGKIADRLIGNHEVAPYVDAARDAIVRATRRGKKTSPGTLLNNRKGQKCGNKQCFRLALRLLEALGEYEGFAEDRSLGRKR